MPGLDRYHNIDYEIFPLFPQAVGLMGGSISASAKQLHSSPKLLDKNERKCYLCLVSDYYLSNDNRFFGDYIFYLAGRSSMTRIKVLSFALLLMASAGLVSAQTIVCDGRTCGGSGVVSWDGQLRDYVYRVTGGTAPPALDSVFVGTHDPDLTHYSSICLPTGWTYEIIPISRQDYSNPINHSVASPAPDGNCPYTFLFRNVSGAGLSSSTATDFGFNYYGYSHNVDWTVAAFPPVSANWAAGVGTGAGPVHGPRCDTLCESGFPVPYHYLAGKKDNFATADGPEPSSPSAPLLAYMATISGGANPYFDSHTMDRCFGHTFSGWDTSGCIVGAQLCFRLTAVGEGNNDFFNIRDDATTAVWGPVIKYLKAWDSGDPADTFWTTGDTLEVCLDLANMPVMKRGTTYYWPPNILATLDDGQLDFIMADDSKIDFLELTVEVCTDTCWATGDVNGDGLSLTNADLIALANFVNNRILPMGPLWQCDLNGDDHVDQADIDIYTCYFTYGMSCFPIYPVPTDCDPDTTLHPDSIVIFDLLHTPLGNAVIDSAEGDLIVSNVGSTGTDGVTIECSPDCDPHELPLWEGVLKNPDLSGTLPVGAKLEAAYTGVIDDIPDQLFMTMSQTKMAANQWQLSVSSFMPVYLVEAWRNGWVVFHLDSVSGVDLGNIVETAKGVFPTTIVRGTGTGKPASRVATGWQWGAPDGVQWTWAAHGVENMDIDELVVDAQPGELLDTCDWRFSSVSIRAKDIPSFTILHERKADVDTATVFGLYHLSEGFADIAGVSGKLFVTPADTLQVDSGQCGYAGMVDRAIYDFEDNRRWMATLENPDSSGSLPDSAKLRVLFRGDIDGKQNQPLMALFQTKMASNQWGLGVSSITSTYTVEAKRNDSVVFHGGPYGDDEFGYIVETAKGVNPTTPIKGTSTGKPTSRVAGSYAWGDSIVGVQWTWAAHGVSNLTINELEVSWTAPNVVTLADVSVMVMDIPHFTIIDEVRSDAVVAGDANDDESANVGDAVYLIGYVFKGGAPPPSKGEGDANGDCSDNVGDAVYLISYVFKGGAAPIINDDCTW
jgi:hypothetical protein